MEDLKHIRYEMPEIRSKWPVAIIGAGKIVEAAHLPAYELAGIPVESVYDLDVDRARWVAARFKIPFVHHSLTELVARHGANGIYDVSVPGSQMKGVIERLPENSYVLTQKPVGESLQEAEEILGTCKRSNITAAVNLQLRYAPFVLMANQMLEEGRLGELCNVEIYVNVYTPFHNWQFLRNAGRVEILYHSIHYIDLFRKMLGEPQSIFASSTKHPAVDQLQSVRSDIIFNYGPYLRAAIITNHMHYYSTQHQDAYIKIEGTKGALKIRMGLLLDYPVGQSDKFEYILSNSPDDAMQQVWKDLPVNGSWVPHAFIGAMNELIKTRVGDKTEPDNSIEDAIQTMRLVERAYNMQGL